MISSQAVPARDELVEFELARDVEVQQGGDIASWVDRAVGTTADDFLHTGDEGARQIGAAARRRRADQRERPARAGGGKGALLQAGQSQRLKSAIGATSLREFFDARYGRLIGQNNVRRAKLARDLHFRPVDIHSDNGMGAVPIATRQSLRQTPLAAILISASPACGGSRLTDSMRKGVLGWARIAACIRIKL